MGRRRARAFVKEAVVLFGFLNGLWLAIGVNPARTLLQVLEGIVARLTGGAPVAFVFTLLPIVLVAAMLVLIHKRAGWLGFAAVGLAFVAGLWLLVAPTLAFFLLLGGLGVGYLATR